MSETIAQYAARIYTYIEGKDPLPVQRQTVAALQELIAGVPADVLSREPAPGKWSVREILAHLAEAEIVTTWRYRQMIEHSGVTVAAFDQNEWVRVGDYAGRVPFESLNLLRMLRENNLRMLARLTPEEWQRFGIHAERGKMTVHDLVRQIAGHDLNHIQQVRQIVNQA